MLLLGETETEGEKEHYHSLTFLPAYYRHS